AKDLHTAEACTIALRLAITRIRPGVGDISQRAAGKQTVLRMAVEREGAGLGQEAIGVVLEGGQQLTIEALGDQTKVVVVSVLYTSHKGPRPCLARQQTAIIAIR